MFVILLATYNGANYIEQQLDSIVSQSYTNWYLLISDDGSKDATIEIIQNYVDKYPEQISLIYNTSGKHGAKNNFMNLIANAPVGKYYAFCDQDDVWESNKLELLVLEYNKDDHEPMLVYHDLKVVDEQLQVLGDSFSKYTQLSLDLDSAFVDLMKCNYIPGCAISFNDKLMKLIKLPGDKVSIHDWWTMLIASAFGKIKMLQKPLGLYRQHNFNTIGIVSKESGVGLFRRYFGASKFQTVFRKIKGAKIETLNMLQEFMKLYGDELVAEKQKLCSKNIHYLCSSNKIASLLWGLKKGNRQKGLVKNIFFWTVSIR